MFVQLDQLDTDSHKAILLYSGGFDSTLVALLLKAKRIETIALSINYLTRPKPEIDISEKLSADLGFRKHIQLDLPLGDDRKYPERWPSAQHEAWFPFRNIIFFGIAAHVAVKNGFNVIASGIRVWDIPDFDDASVDFFNKFSEIIQFSGCSDYSGRLRLLLPLIDSHELAETALLEGGEMEKTLRQTWSCWRDGIEPCGECDPCVSREEFFEQVAIMKEKSHERR